MLHMDDPAVKALCLSGEFGLERENIRILPDGSFSHVLHPFSAEETHIVYDFCENQLEVNTGIAASPEEAAGLLEVHTREIQERLVSMEKRELLWPFSNPPYIKNEEDIPIARHNEVTGHDRGYREYLADKYGRYKMTFCGIHVNYSFTEELLEVDFKSSEETDFRQYKNNLFLHVAEGAAQYGWIITALTAASPLLDSSYLETGKRGKTVFNGRASIRCSELGYWNQFTPVLSFASIDNYADCIQKYVDDGLLIAPSELYYPVRLKPKGKNTMENLRKNGVNHLELRMVDINPFEMAGINHKDLAFVQLFLVWLAGTDHQSLLEKDQILAVQNLKNAACYDLKNARIERPDGTRDSVEREGLRLIASMREFYKSFPEKTEEILAFEEEKLLDPDQRYAWRVRKEFEEDFLGRGLKWAEELQKSFLNVEKNYRKAF